MRRFVLVILLGLLGPSWSLGHAEDTPVWGQWSEARSLFKSGNTQEAIDALRAHPSQTAAYFYNLGTAYLRLGEVGPAVAYLEKARRLSPEDLDVQHNLQLSRDALGRAIGEDRLDPAASWVERLAQQLPLLQIQGYLGVLAILLVLLCARAYVLTKNLRTALMSVTGSLLLFTLGCSAGFSIFKYIAERHQPAALVKAEVFRSGPGGDFLEISRVPAGTKVRVIGAPDQAPASADSQWLLVRFAKNGIGWVPASSLLLL